jgi:hypothetical protein
LIIDPELLGEELHQFHIQTIAAAGDEIGIRHSQVPENAFLPDLREITGAQRPHCG